MTKKKKPVKKKKKREKPLEIDMEFDEFMKRVVRVKPENIRKKK